MPAFTVEEIVRGTRGALIGGDLGIAVAGVSIDSRTLNVGEVFFAIRGDRLDGHAFLRDAVGRGAGCLVVDTVPDELPAGVPLVLVDDATLALGRLGAWHRARFSIPVASVTGSNGKTTTKEMLAAILGVSRRVLKTEGNLFMTGSCHIPRDTPAPNFDAMMKATAPITGGMIWPPMLAVASTAPANTGE